MPTTTKYALPSPSGTDNAFPPEDIQALADAVDSKMAGWATPTTLASRPPAGKAGLLHRSTDTGEISLDTGSAWLTLVQGSDLRLALPGDLRHTFRGSAASGWLFLDGTTVSRTTYANLFALFGTTYNTGGEAGTDFRLPDCRGRILVAKGTHADVDTLGDNDGLAVGSRRPKHTHTVAAHNHGAATGGTAPATDSQGAHTHTLPFSGGPSSSFAVDQGGGGTNLSVATGVGAPDGGHGHGFSAPTGSSGAHTHTVASHTHSISNDTPATDAQGAAYLTVNVEIKT
jgi:microcystin-dependent protein